MRAQTIPLRIAGLQAALRAHVARNASATRGRGQHERSARTEHNPNTYCAIGRLSAAAGDI